ncbi:MAG: ribosome biogenesis GTP-binding protein YihA/YsxC [Rhodothermales bacterium]
MKIHDVRFVKGAVRWDHLPTDGLPEVAFVGRSNVGKSSLLNMLVGRLQLARTSGTPGKTQEFNFYLVNRRFYLVDLPGYGYARIARRQRNRWGRFIGRYLNERAPLRVVFHLIDSRHPPTARDRDVIAEMRGSPVPYIIVLTKTDKLSGNQRVRSRAEVEKVLRTAAMEVPIILTSAKDKRGREELLEWIDQLVDNAEQEVPGDPPAGSGPERDST